MTAAQLSFLGETETEHLSKELAHTKDQLRCLRRGVFSRYDRLVADTNDELNKLRQEVLTLRQYLNLELPESKVINLHPGC